MRRKMPQGRDRAVRQIILASASPRRKELLAYIVGGFDIIPSDIEEIASGPPKKQVVKLAQDKALDIAKDHHDAVVIGADTLVAIGDQILGKPKDTGEAAQMLRLLSGRTHTVYTGVAVVCGDDIKTVCCTTNVTFDTLSEDEITAYIATGEPMDKAGAYGIQGYGGKFIKRIDGCYFNVMGLPQSTVYSMLKKIGLEF